LLTISQASLWMPKVDTFIPSRERLKSSLQVAWQVLSVALLFPILGKVLPTALSPLKPILVEGMWDRVGGGNFANRMGAEGKAKGTSYTL